MCDGFGFELLHKIGVPERSFSRLIDDDLTWKRLQLIYNIMTMLATNKQSSHLSLIANDFEMLFIAWRGVLSYQFGGRTIRKIGQMALSGVEYWQTGIAASLKKSFHRIN